jgi:hypothetical protein
MRFGEGGGVHIHGNLPNARSGAVELEIKN